MSRLAEQVGISLEVAPTLAEQDAFGSISGLSGLDKEHQDVVHALFFRGRNAAWCGIWQVSMAAEETSGGYPVCFRT